MLNFYEEEITDSHALKQKQIHLKMKLEQVPLEPDQELSLTIFEYLRIQSCKKRHINK